MKKLQVSLSDELHENLKTYIDYVGVSMSSYVALLIANDIKENLDTVHKIEEARRLRNIHLNKSQKQNSFSYPKKK